MKQTLRERISEIVYEYATGWENEPRIAKFIPTDECVDAILTAVMEATKELPYMDAILPNGAIGKSILVADIQSLLKEK